MFGIFYVLLALIISIVAGIKYMYDDGQSRQSGLEKRKKGENPGNVWWDRNNQLRDLDTGAIRKIERNGRMDTIITDANGRVIKNISLEKRMMDAAKRAAEADEGTKAVFLENWSHEYSQITRVGNFGVIYDAVEGKVYKDIKTGELYILRRFRWYDNNMEEFSSGTGMGALHYAWFYMNTKGYLVCQADEICHRDANEEDCQKFIEYFNQKQREGGWGVTKYTAKDKFLNDFYCNRHQI